MLGLRAHAFRSAAPATCLRIKRLSWCRSVLILHSFIPRTIELSRWSSVVEIGESCGLGLDVRRDLSVAICEDGKVVRAGEVPSTSDGVRPLAESLLA